MLRDLLSHVGTCPNILQAVNHTSKPLTPPMYHKAQKTANSPGSALAKSPSLAGMPSFQVTCFKLAEMRLVYMLTTFRHSWPSISTVQTCTGLQVLADVAAADAFAAKGASDIDARQMQATLRSLVADAVKNSTGQAAISPPANAQQAMLRYALARHGNTCHVFGIMYNKKGRSFKGDYDSLCRHVVNHCKQWDTSILCLSA